MKCIIGLAFIFVFIKGFGQGAMPNNLIKANALVPLVFNYQYAEELLQPKIINQAIELKINPSLYQQYIISANIRFSNPSIGSVMTDLLTLKLINSTSVGNKDYKEIIPLSTTPVIVTHEFFTGRSVPPYSLFYELVLNPSKKIIPAGNTDYTIHFTLSSVISGVPAMSSMIALQGSIHIPPLYSFKIEKTNQQEIHFDNALDFDKGKTYSGFYKATVISNVPYLIEVMAASNSFSATESFKEMPADIISLSGNNGSSYIAAGSTPQPLLFSNTKELINVRYLNLHLKPGWDIPGGEYNILINFIISAQ